MKKPTPRKARLSFTNDELSLLQKALIEYKNKMHDQFVYTFDQGFPSQATILRDNEKATKKLLDRIDTVEFFNTEKGKEDGSA